MSIKINARTDGLKDLVVKSDLFKGLKLAHTPFLVFDETKDPIEVIVVDTKEKLLSYPDDTQFMMQWIGRYRSDWFTTSVGYIKTLLK